MAKKTMTASLSSFRAQRYEGQYAATDGTVSVQGDFSTNASKEIESVSGEVSVAGEIVGPSTRTASAKASAIPSTTSRWPTSTP